MGRRFGVSYEERRDAVERYLRHECSMNDLAKQLKVTTKTIRRWISRYQSFGSEGLQDSCRNQPYSSTLKEAVVREYLSGLHSQVELCGKYGMKSTRQLRNWIANVNAGINLTFKRRKRIDPPAGNKTPVMMSPAYPSD